MFLCTWKHLSEARLLVNRGYQVLYLNPVKHQATEQTTYGHLTDLNKSRLEESAQTLGIKNAKIYGLGSAEQRIVLSGSPLRKALVSADPAWMSWFNPNQVTT